MEQKKMDKEVKKPHGEAYRNEIHENSNRPFQYLAWQKATNPVKFMFDQSGGKIKCHLSVIKVFCLSPIRHRRVGRKRLKQIRFAQFQSCVIYLEGLCITEWGVGSVWGWAARNAFVSLNPLFPPCWNSSITLKVNSIFCGSWVCPWCWNVTKRKENTYLFNIKKGHEKCIIF